MKIQWDRTLIYSERLDNLVLVTHLEEPTVSFQTALYQHLDMISSHELYESGKPWKVIDEWVE